MNQHLRSVSGCGGDAAAMQPDTQTTLKALEEQAWEAYRSQVRLLALPEPAIGQDTFLGQHILPGLTRIGVDADFGRLLFGLASRAWQAVTIDSDKVVRLHPNLQRDIAEVREGLLIQSEKKMALRSGPIFLSPQETYDQLQAAMDPANLHLLIDEITTPWIVLPRAYASLQADHLHYLPVYLELIANETNEEALHIFSRIAIEFLANYSIRYANEEYSRQKIVCLVTAAYCAHYWRNLLTPPTGFEDVRLFEHFLSWLKHSGCRSRTSGHDLDQTIADMEHWKAHIFPAESDLMTSDESTPELSRFMVSLRHGCKGIDCAVRYFWLTPESPNWPRRLEGQWSVILFALKSLFKLIECRYQTESKRTRYYIREFLFQLKNTYTAPCLPIPSRKNRTRLLCVNSNRRSSLWCSSCSIRWQNDQPIIFGDLKPRVFAVYCRLGSRIPWY